MPFLKKIILQFNIRSSDFEKSANWIVNKKLITAHLEIVEELKNGRVLDLCCGTGQIGRLFAEKGWQVEGVDISDDMVKRASRYFRVKKGTAANMPFEDERFDKVVCRQAFQFFDEKKVLTEINRVLMPAGELIMSLTVPFSEKDAGYLNKIHTVKQPLLKVFYTKKSFIEAIKENGFRILNEKELRTRENITKWMKYAPELTEETRKNVMSLIRNAPKEYNDAHKVEVNGELIEEYWNWIIIKAEKN